MSGTIPTDPNLPSEERDRIFLEKLRVLPNEELASRLEKVLPGNYYIVEAAARIRELEELKFNHLPKVQNALQRANTEGMKCDETIADFRSRLRGIEDKKPESCSTTGDGRLTIDEAISHASEVADRKGCTACGNQHKQLADWLTELKVLRKRMDFLEKVRLIPKDYQGCLVKWTVEGGWHDKDGQVEGELGQINTEHYGCISNIKDGLMRIEHCSHIVTLHNLWVDMIQCDESEKNK